MIPIAYTPGIDRAHPPVILLSFRRERGALADGPKGSTQVLEAPTA